MRPRWWSPPLVMVALGLVCLTAGEPASHEAVVQGMLGALEKISATLETVRDEATAEAARPDLRKQAEAWRALRKRADALPPPERDAKDRLAKEYKGKMDESLKRLFAQIGRVQALPGARPALQEISGVLTQPER